MSDVKQICHLSDELIIQIMSWLEINHYYKFTATCKRYVKFNKTIILKPCPYFKSLGYYRIFCEPFKVDYEHVEISDNLIKLIIKYRAYKLFYTLFQKIRDSEKISKSMKHSILVFQTFINSEIIQPDLKPTNNEIMFESMINDNENLWYSYTKNFYTNNGAWSNIEKKKFAEGVKMFGWGYWSDISFFIDTRDFYQVNSFSKNYIQDGYSIGR